MDRSASAGTLRSPTTVSLAAVPVPRGQQQQQQHPDQTKLVKNNRNTIALAQFVQNTAADLRGFHLGGGELVPRRAAALTGTDVNGSGGGGGYRMDYTVRTMTTECVETWLDMHPEFVAHYFTRRATKTMVDDWLQANTQCRSSPEAARSDFSSNGSGGTNTPVRKISAQEFEKDGQILKSMISTVDGQVTFLGSPLFEQQRPLRRKRDELKSSDERELMYELVMDICNDLDVTSLCHKILQNVSILLNADRCSLFLVQGDDDKRTLTSKLFDVNSNSTIEECTGQEQDICVPWGRGIVGTVAKTGQALNIPDAYEVSTCIASNLCVRHVLYVFVTQLRAHYIIMCVYC